ncbi:MAG: glycosyltransferase family 39 protein [Steroidobacteraceae bacterium]|nr:glycosyltransferase family 39 protein [Nevskiaceae bacterium]MCP5339002.1 glycosyltransferase family 39 protein [Nevskiaceae bacterium]MCP5359586.1 glycosyltransferase family 39 protein [Nevskiaceae bacterium]MCP5472621.1 glycosyltransferase family 39 protein [Nevskiaceae bacterium]
MNWRDVGWILLAVAVLIASGYGLRDPWPADEPRFAVLARDMVASGDWLFPRVGGDLYQDKPPLYFWLLALSYAAFGSVRASFLLPSLLATVGTLLLVYSLATRLHGRRAGLAAALLLACCVQFVQTMRSAQIDPTLLFFSTLSLWALTRHLLLGPDWRAYLLGGFAAGLGTITKGVGFLPLLLVPLYFALRGPRWNLATIAGGRARWALAPAGFLFAVALWLGPMLLAVATRGDPGLLAYRDEILFQQTVQRYAASWHHLRPWYFFLVEVIPALWLPASALLFWLVPRWRNDFAARRGAVWLPLLWALLVVVFFSISPGKRGIYVLPALPAFALAAAAHLDELLARRGVQRLSLVLAALLIVPGVVLAIGDLLDWPPVTELLSVVEPGSTSALLAFAMAAPLVWLVAARFAPLLAWPAMLACLALVWGFGIAPQLNPQRSASAFVAEMLRRVPPGRELGLVAYKEQFLLGLDRDTVNFGHARWREGSRESDDAAAWLAAAPQARVLLVPQALLAPCFTPARRIDAGRTARETWWLVSGRPEAACVARGNRARAIRYPAHRIG